MQYLLSNINIIVNENLYVKDPKSSDLGKKIIESSINMINDLGFESFTFSKLGKHINSTEASIYRYFEGKHKLLIYLTSLYWGWMEYQLAFSLANIDDSQERLTRALRILTCDQLFEIGPRGVDSEKLYQIVICESSKAYLTKNVDQENQKGYFGSYKNLVARVGDLILECNPNYACPHMLVSTVIEGSHHQHFFASHLPMLTNTGDKENHISEFYKELVFKALEL